MENQYTNQEPVIRQETQVVSDGSIINEEPQHVETKQRYSPWLLMLIVGVIFFVIGLSVEIPSTKLTTYSYYENDDNYYYVESYVGGDAYNFIVAAAQNGGEIAAKTIEKSIYISVGVFMFVLGGVMIDADIRNKKRRKEEKDGA